MEKKPMLVLSKTEQDVLRVLWDAEEPLSVAEICDRAERNDIELNQSTVQANVARLQKKGLLRMEGFSQKFKSYARAFVPTMNRADFVMNQTCQMIDYFGAGDDVRLTALLAARDQAEEKNTPSATAEVDKGNGK